MKNTALVSFVILIGFSVAHRTDRILGTCPSGWDEAGYICYKYNHEKKDLMEAWKSCHEMGKHWEIDQHFIEDESLLLTVGKLYEFIRDGHEVSGYFHHTVRLNAIKSDGKWWELQKLPSGHFHKRDISSMVDHVQEITGVDAAHIGFGLDTVASAGEDGDGLIFNPDEKMIKISDADFDFPYVCTHKRENRPGERCPGQVAECNDRGNCFYGLCECRDGYIGDSCIQGCPPKPQTMPDFDSSRYLGDWYQISGLPSIFQPSGQSCVRATYGDNGDGTISVRNVAFQPDGVTFTQICGFANVPDPTYPAELLVNFPFQPPGEYWLLDTDYDNFASVYSCSDATGLFTYEFAWILVRDPSNVSDDIMQRAMDAFTNQNLNILQGFEAVNQEGCVYEDPSGAAACQS